MKTIFKILVLLISLNNINAQQKIRFEYDNFGNQIVRELCSNCPSRSNMPIKNFSDIKNEDLISFFPNDQILYYPNPVNNELYLKWNIETDSVLNIEVYDLNGKLLKIYQDLNNLNNSILSFDDYPSGYYIVNLNYVSKEIKSIKILKK